MELVAAAAGILIGLSIWALVGAIIFRAAVALANKFLGSPGTVPDPSFGKAVLIVVATTVVNMVVGFVAGLVAGAGSAAADAGPSSAQIGAQLISLVISFFVASGMYSAMLPTSFGRAMLVTVCQYIIILLIAMVLLVIVFGLSMMLGGR